MVAHQFIKNCDIDVTDVDRADKILGPDLGSLKGKTVHNAPAPVVDLPPLAVLKPIFDNHKHVTLSADIFYLDGILFFFTISRNVQFKTVDHIKTKPMISYSDASNKSYKSIVSEVLLLATS